MGQSVCKCCNCTSSADANKRHTSKIYPQKPLKVDCVWTQGSSLPSSIYRHHTSFRSSNDSDFHSLGTSMGEDSSLKKSGEDLASGEITTEIFNGGDLSELPVFLKKLKDVTVKVGTSTRITVEIICSTDFVVTWYRNDNQILANDDYKIIHEGTLYAIEFTCLNVQDNGRWTCSAESNKGRITSSCYLKVNVPKSYKKPVFYEELEAVLTDEGTVSLQCKVVGVPTPLLRWFKDGREIKAGDIFALAANSRDPVNLGVYTCEASNCMGKAYSSSRVKVNSKSSLSPRVQEVISVAPSGQPPIFIQDLKDENVKVGESFILSCQIAVPPWPKSIKWQNPQEQFVDVTEERYRDLADGLGGYMLEIISSEECDRGTWKCVAVSGDNSVAVSSCNIQIWVPKTYRKPYFVEKLKAVLTEDGLVSFECKVVGYPTPYLRWFKDGSELKAGDIYQLTGISSLGFYVCIAKNCMGEAKSEAELTVDDIKQQLSHEETLLLSTIRQPPKFLKKLMSCEASINSSFKFTVQVKTPPTSKLLWYRDDHMIEINDKKYSQKMESMGISHLNITKLEFEDQAEWKCVASNEFGRSECSCFLKLIIPKHYKKPKFLENLRAILTENGVVNLECKVIGVPQPTLIWYKDGVELNPGDIHKIMSGQDGTCCLGVYTCEARNCMGSVTSSASVHGIEDATHVKPKIRRLSLSTINEEDTFKTADDEQSLINDQPHEISYSFDGKEISVSYYDTPDITHEEAIQIVEMYADQLSEHISEHNVLELPPLRIVKETSTASNILMEGVVIDIQPEYFTVEEDLRTEAGIEDISVIEDTLFSSKTSKFSFETDSYKNTREKYSDIKSTSDSTIQSPELYYSLSESKRDHSSLPISPRSRQSMELETESYISAKSYETTEKNAKKYLQDSPDRSISITDANYVSPKLEDVTDDSVLRHNTQFITILLTNNLTDIQQRLCYMEKEMYLKSLKQQPKITDGVFKDTSGLIQSIQKLREFFLNFKQKKNGNSISVTFLDLYNIVQKLQINICNIHTNVINDLNETSQKNSIQIVYQIGETLVNVLDLIGDILKLDTFELCRSNVTQSEKQRLFNLILDTRNKLNELVIGTHNLFVDVQDNVVVDKVETLKRVKDERETFEQEESATNTSREKKDEQKREIIEKQLVELEIGKDKHKEEIMEEIFTYQEDKINDILFDLDLVKPLFATLSELRVSDINYSEIFENNTVKKLLFSIFEIEKEIIHSELQQIRLIELDETDYSRITQYEANKIALKFKLAKINEQQNILSRMPNILKMDQYSKDVIQNILSLEWLEDKENELKEYLATVIRRKASLSLKTSQHLRDIEIEKEQSTQENIPNIPSEQKSEDKTLHVQSDVKEPTSITEITPENILNVLSTTELELNAHEKYIFIEKLKYYLVKISQEEMEIIENYVLDNHEKLDSDVELKEYAGEIVTQLNEIKWKSSKSPSKMIEQELLETELIKIQVTQLALRKFNEVKDQMQGSLNIIPDIITNILKTVEEQKQLIIKSLILRGDTQTERTKQSIKQDKIVSEIEYEYLSKTQKEIVEQRTRDRINLKEYFLQMSEEQKSELIKDLISHYDDKNYYEYLKIEEDQLLTEIKNKITQKLLIENAESISQKDSKLAQHAQQITILDGEISEFKNVLCATQIKKITFEKILESNIQKEYLQDIGLNLISDVILEKSEQVKIIQKPEHTHDLTTTTKADSVQEQIFEKSEDATIIKAEKEDTITAIDKVDNLAEQIFEKVSNIEERILEKPKEMKITEKAEEKYEITTTEKVPSIAEQILEKAVESKIIQEAEEKYESTTTEKVAGIPEQISEKHEELQITKEAEGKYEITTTEKVASIAEQILEKAEESKIIQEAEEKYESITTEKIAGIPEQISEKHEELKITKEVQGKCEITTSDKVASIPEQIQEKSEELKITKIAEDKYESTVTEKVVSIPEQLQEKPEELEITKEAKEKYETIATEKVASIPEQILEKPGELKITKETEEKYEITATEKVADIREQILEKPEEKYESFATEKVTSIPEQILKKSEKLKITKEAEEKYESVATEEVASIPEQIQEKSEELNVTGEAEEKYESIPTEKVASIPEQILEKPGELKITEETEEKYEITTIEKVANIPEQGVEKPEELKVTKATEEKYESVATEKVANIPEPGVEKPEELKVTKATEEKYESVANEKVANITEHVLEKPEKLKITTEAEEKYESTTIENVACIPEQILDKPEKIKITKEGEEKYESIATEKVVSIPEQTLEEPEKLKITKESEEKYDSITTEKVASIPEQTLEKPEKLEITKESEEKYESMTTEKVASIPEQRQEKLDEFKITETAEEKYESTATEKVGSIPEKILEKPDSKIIQEAAEKCEIIATEKVGSIPEQISQKSEQLKIIKEAGKVLETSLILKVDSVPEQMLEKSEQLKVVKKAEEVTEPDKFDETSSLHKELVTIEKLKQYLEIIPEFQKGELIEEVALRCKEMNYIDELIQNEQDLQSKMEKLESVIFSRGTENENNAQEITVQTQEKEILEPNLIQTQIKILALGKLTEMLEETNQVEDLVKSTLLCLPNVLTEKENLIKVKVNKNDIQTLSSPIENIIDEAKQKIKEKLTGKDDTIKTRELHKVIKLKEHVASILETDKDELLKELCSNYKNENFMDHLILEEEKLQAQLKTVETELQTLGSISTLAFEPIAQVPEKENNLEQVSILKEKQTNLETSLFKTQIKVLALAKVSEMSIDNLEAEIQFENVLINLPEILNEKEITIAENIKDSFSQAKQIKETVMQDKIIVGQEKLSKQTIELVENAKIMQQQELVNIKKLKQYAATVSEVDKAEILQDLLINYNEETALSKLVSEEDLLNAQINRLELLNEGVISEVPLEEISDRLITQPSSEKVHISKQEKLQLEQNLFKTQIKKLVIEQISEKSDQSNPESLLKDTLSHITDILEEKEKTVSSTVHKEEISADTERKIDIAISQKPQTEIIAEKITYEQEEEPKATVTLQKYLTSISESDKMDIVKDLSVNWKNEDFVKGLITEEAKLKEEIKEIKVEKLHLHSVSEIPLEKIEELPLTHYDKANILEEKLSSLELKLSQVQVKMMAIGKVSQIDDSSADVEDLFMDALTLPTVLEEKGYIANKSEVKETPITLNLDSKLQTEEIFKQKFDNEKIKEHCNSLSKVQVSEMVNELSLNYNQENYVKTLEAEKVQLINEINETELQKTHLESIKESAANKKIKNESEQISILQQKQVLLESQLMDNCIKNLALEIISHTDYQTEISAKLFENTILAIPKLFEAKKEVIGKEQTALPKSLIEDIHNKKEHLKEIDELKNYVISISSENKTNLIKELITECKFEQPEYKLVETETELKTKLKAISQNEPTDNTIEQKQLLESQLKNVQIKKLVLEKIQEHQQPLESLEILFENILLQLPTVFEHTECSINASLTEDLKMAELSETKVYQDLTEVKQHAIEQDLNAKLTTDVIGDSQHYASEIPITTENIEEVLLSDQVVEDIQTEQAKIEKAMELENKIQLGKIVTTTELGIKETVATLDSKNISAESANISEVEQMESKVNIDQIEVINDTMKKEIDESQLNITYATCSNIMEEEIVDELFNQMKESDQSVIATLLESKEKQLTDELNKVKAIRILTDQNIQQITIETTDTLSSEDIIEKQQQVTELQEKEDVLEKNVFALKIQQLALAKLENIEVGDIYDLKHDIQQAVASILEEEHVKDVVTIQESVKTIEKAPEIKEIKFEKVVPEKIETPSSPLIKEDEKQIGTEDTSEEVNISETEISAIEQKPGKSELDKIEKVEVKEEKSEIEKIDKEMAKKEKLRIDKDKEVEVKEEKSEIDKTEKVKTKGEKCEIDKIEKIKSKKEKSEIDEIKQIEIEEEKSETEKIEKEKTKEEKSAIKKDIKAVEEKLEVHKTAKVEVKEEKPEIEIIKKAEEKEENLGKVGVKEEKPETDKIEKVEVKKEKPETDKNKTVEVKEEKSESDKIEKAKIKEEKSEVDKTVKVEVKEEKPETEELEKEKAERKIEIVTKAKEKQEKSEVDETAKVEVKEEKLKTEKIKKAEETEETEEKSEVDKTAIVDVKDERPETDKIIKIQVKEEKLETQKIKKPEGKEEKSEVDKTVKVEVKDRKPETSKIKEIKEEVKEEKSEISKIEKAKEKEEKSEVDKIAKIEVKEEKAETEKVEKVEKVKAKQKSEIVKIEKVEEKLENKKIEKRELKEEKSDIEKTKKETIQDEKSEIEKIEKVKKKEKSETDKVKKVDVKEEKSEIKKITKAEKKEETSEIEKTAKVEKDNQETEIQSVRKEKLNEQTLTLLEHNILSQDITTETAHELISVHSKDEEYANEFNIMDEKVQCEIVSKPQLLCLSLQSPLEFETAEIKDVQLTDLNVNVKERADYKLNITVQEKEHVNIAFDNVMEQTIDFEIEQINSEKTNVTYEDKEIFSANIIGVEIKENIAKLDATEKLSSVTEISKELHRDMKLEEENKKSEILQTREEQYPEKDKIHEDNVKKDISDTKSDSQKAQSQNIQMLEKVDKKTQENEELNKETAEISSKSHDKQEKTKTFEKREIKDDEEVKVKIEKKEKHKKIKEEEKQSIKVETKEEKNEKDTIRRDQKEISKTEMTGKEDKKIDILDTKETTKTEKSLVSKVEGDIQKVENIIVAEEIKEKQTETKLVKEADKEESRITEKAIEKKDIIDNISEPATEQEQKTKIKEREDVKEKEIVIEAKEKDRKKEDVEKKTSIKEVRKDDTIRESKDQTKMESGADVKEKEVVIEAKEKDRRKKEEMEKKASIKEVRKDDTLIESKDQTKKESKEGVKEKEAVIEVKEKDKRKKEETEQKDSIKEVRMDDTVIKSKEQTKTETEEKEKTGVKKIKTQKSKDETINEQSSKTKIQDTESKEIKNEKVITERKDKVGQVEKIEDKIESNIKEAEKEKSEIKIKDEDKKVEKQVAEDKQVLKQRRKSEDKKDEQVTEDKQVQKQRRKSEDKKDEKQVAEDKQVQKQRRKSEDKKDEKQVAEDKQVQKQRRKSEDKNNKTKTQSKDKEDNIETKVKDKDVVIERKTTEDVGEKKEIVEKHSSKDKEDIVETKTKQKEIVIERKTEDKVEKKEGIEKESSIKDIKEKEIKLVEKEKEKREKSKEKQIKEQKQESEKLVDKKTEREENLKNGKKIKTQEQKEMRKEKTRKSPSIELSTEISKKGENKIDTTDEIKLQYTAKVQITKEQTYEINEDKDKRIDLKLKEENKEEEKEKYKMVQQKTKDIKQSAQISDRKEEKKESRIEKYEVMSNKEKIRERKELSSEKQKVEIRKSTLDETDRIERLLQRSKEQRLEKLSTKETIKSNYLLRDERDKEKERDARSNRLKNIIEPSEINVYKEKRRAIDTRHIDSYSKSLDVLKQDKYSVSSMSRLPTYTRKYSDSMSNYTSVPESMRVSTRKSYVTKNQYFPYSNIDNFVHIRDDIKQTHGRIQNLLKSSKEITNSLSAMSSRHARLQKYEYEPFVQKSMQMSSYSTYSPYQSSRSIYRNRSSNMFTTCMDYQDYYKHYFKLPIAYAVYKANLDRSHLYPRRYEITLYYGLLRRQHTIVRGYKSLEYGTAISKIIKRESLEQMDMSAIKFNCTDSCHAYNKECSHKSNVTSLVTKGKLVLGHKGFVDARPIMSQKRSVVWESPDYEKYARDKQTESIVTRDRADFAFVQVTPRPAPLMDQKKSISTTFMSVPMHETVEKGLSHLPHSSKSQKTATIFIARPDSLISVAPGQDIIISFKINEDSSTKIYLTKRFADVTKNPRFRSEKYGNLIRFTLTNANYEDMGTYCLSVENNYNSSRSYITVTVDSNMRNTTYYKLLRNQMLPPVIRNTTIPTRSKLQDISFGSLSYRRSCSPSPSYSVSPPIFYTLPHNIVTEPGETVRFQITVGGFPSPSVTWLKNGILVLSSGKIRIIEKFNTKILEIVCVSSDDAGTYTVIIQNEAGRALSTAKLDLIQLRQRPYLLRLRY